MKKQQQISTALSGMVRRTATFYSGHGNYGFDFERYKSSQWN